VRAAPARTRLSPRGAPTEALGIDDRTGTLAAGWRADLQAVRGDPLAEIALLGDTEAIALVMRDGKTPLVAMEP